MTSDLSGGSPLSDVAEGAVKGALDWSADKIAQLITKFKAGELSFIEDKDTIELVKTQREKPEFKLIRKHVKNKDQRLKIEMGFALKKLESNPLKLQNLRDKIRRKYGSHGLHIAQLVQSGILSKYIGFLLGKTENDREFGEGIEIILNDIEKYVAFIRADEDIELKGNEIATRINANLPNVFIVFASGKAVEISKVIADLVMKQVNGYSLEAQTESDPLMLYQFIIKQRLPP